MTTRCTFFTIWNSLGYTYFSNYTTFYSALIPYCSRYLKEDFTLWPVSSPKKKKKVLSTWKFKGRSQSCQLSISIHCRCFATLVLHTNNSSVSGGNDLLGSRGEFDSGFLSLGVVGDHSGVVSRGASQLSTVTRLLLQAADDGTLRHDTNRQHITNVQLGYKSEGYNMNSSNTCICKYDKG